MPFCFISVKRVGERCVRIDGERIDHHAGFEFLDLTYQRGLLLGSRLR